MDIIRTDKAPAPLGPYEQAVIHNGTIYIAMQLPITAEGDTSSLMDIEEQARLVLDNVKAILEAGGSSMNKVLRVTVYLKDLGQGSRVNTVYEEFFPDHKPARGVIGIAGLPLGYGIAMDVTAAVS